MKSVYKVVGVLVLAALVAVGSAAKAEALTISITPSTQDAFVGNLVSVDIVASDITDPIGGFFFEIDFNDAVLSGDSYTNDPDSKMGPAPLELSGGFAGGNGSPLDLFFIADAGWDETDLGTAQGASFILATIRFMAVGTGLSPIRINAFDISNWDGSSSLPAAAVNGSVCVGPQGSTVPPNCTVPEPGLFAMLGVGLAGLVVARRRLAGKNA
ncbi:MAG: PEP-CTERM sorting domain-containing protein [Acidobacteria bacterium]|nr:PEP-CTERM sorting domain-containing protein [Acidobacteriota bacterium]